MLNITVSTFLHSQLCNHQEKNECSPWVIGDFCFLPSKSEHILIQQTVSSLKVMGYTSCNHPTLKHECPRPGLTEAHQSQLLFCSITICDLQSSSVIVFINTISSKRKYHQHQCVKTTMVSSLTFHFSKKSLCRQDTLLIAA